MSTAREDIAAALAAGLTDQYTIYAYPRSPDLIKAGSRAVCVWTDSLTRDATLSHVRHSVVVWVLSGRSAVVVDLDDDLEAALYDVLDVLTTSDPRWTWTTAERGVLADTWHGYKIDVTAVGRIALPDSPD